MIRLGGPISGEPGFREIKMDPSQTCGCNPAIVFIYRFFASVYEGLEHSLVTMEPI